MLAGCLCLLVDALPSPQPIPAPEPFFGLGLLGRLLAAYSSGDKDEDKGNCKCNRRTFHTKEKDKDKVGCRLQPSVVHLDVEDTSKELLTPALLCHKAPRWFFMA